MAEASHTQSSAARAVGDNIAAHPANWSFGGGVAETFIQHIRRSVPLYDEGHELICSISDYFVAPRSTVYELGVSTGQLTGKLSKRHEGKEGALFIGIDREEAMIAHARGAIGNRPNVRLEVGDVVAWDYAPCDMIVSCYTMQFIPPRVRQDLINKLYQSLHWGGALLLFEKVRAPDARFQDICTGLYTDFKLANGFTEAEILNKSASLKGVLEPFSTEGNLDLLKRAGFVDVMSIMKFVCFEGFLAIK